jgi:glycosyltransferase involved in cell wall biosynthesis
MAKKLCIFTINFAFNRQGMLDFLEKSLPKDVELFLFVPKECKGKYHSERIKIYESNKSKYTCFYDLRKFCKKNNIDRIFSMGALPQEGFIMLLANCFTERKTICHLVVNPFNAFKMKLNAASIKAFIEFIFLYLLVLFTNKFYVISEDLTKLSKKYFFFARNKIDFLTYTLDTDLFHPKDKFQSRKRLGLPQKKKIIIFVGRIEYLKGADIILEIAKKKEDIMFIMIGQLKDKSLLNEKLSNVKIIDSLSSKEFGKLCEYYNAADLCLFPSRIESFALVPREAMACGTPAIVTDIMGMNVIKEAIKVPQDVDVISKKVDNFFDMAEKQRKLLSKKSREYILKTCSRKACRQVYIEKLLH